MGKRKLNKGETTTIDLVSPTSACQNDHKKRVTKQECEEIKKRFERTSPCFWQTLPHRERSKRTITFNNTIVKPKQRLDTNAFECYLENLWRSFSEDKRTSFIYLDCLWFSLYLEASSRAKVLTWIKKKHIFSKKYVFVPIVCWNHWSLLIFCHFGESLQSETRTPCMLLLDSLEMANPKRLEPNIRRFVADIYKAEGRCHNSVMGKNVETLFSTS
ncbi:hypothetical protein L1049_000986 [Liquidambar formosana]|uniref:Ubiquitin-like protease family profile domain-containing protein n=1 Tax=Liquidambar formosana TaxID=63359 RepID=A0AAP0NBH5_LIQFO